MSITSTVNGVDLERLHATIEAVTANPSLGRFQFRARNHWIDGGYSRTTIQGFYGAGQEDATRTQPFTVDSDEPPVLLGENRAPNARRICPPRPRSVSDRHDRLPRRRPRHSTGGSGGARSRGDLDAQGVLGLNDNVRPGYEPDPGHDQGHRRLR